ncbi:hypothetical protein DL96DRAFT_1732962 [Flagelloscypha sp. PMI_526]|nr:hypothetical protein DL96DRAFT_1732962 [Flagelloscypha sp. PMI_526]
MTSSRSDTPTLQRGRACNTCRKRKIRCDAKQPECTNCKKSARPGELCEYNELGKSRNQINEEKIARLEAKIRELEVMNDVNGIRLIDPYAASPNILTIPDLPLDVGSGSSSLSSSPSSAEKEKFSDGTHDEPSPAIKSQLIHKFLDNSWATGLALDPEELRRHALSNPEQDTWAKPPPALMYCYVFLSRCLRHLATSLSHNTYEMVYVIQTQLLLATYYFALDEELQAHYHLGAAVSLTLSMKLHKSGTSPSVGTPPPQTESVHIDTQIQSGLPRKEDVIRLFWGVFVLNCWAAKQDSPTAMTFDLDCGVQVDTPWPLDLHSSEDEQSRSDALPQSRLTLQNFWLDVSQDAPGEFAQFTLLVKAAFLYRQAHNLLRRFQRGQVSLGPQGTFPADFNRLDRLIQRFRDTLPPVEQFSLIPQSAIRIMLFSHSLAHAACIELHSVFMVTDPVSLEKSLAASGAMYALICEIDLQSKLHVGALQADLWFDIQLWSVEDYDIKERKVQMILKEGISALNLFATRSPRFKRLLMRVQDEFPADGFGY